MVTTLQHSLCVRILSLVALYGSAHALAGSQQGLFLGNSTFESAALFRLLSDFKAFTATMEGRIVEANGSEVASWTGWKYALRDESVRIEMDMTRFKEGGKAASQENIEQAKRWHVDQSVVIADGKERVTYTLYPGRKVYTPHKLKQSEVVAWQDLNVGTERVGTETIEGQACVKNRVTVSDPAGMKTEFLVWSATALNNFPVKVQRQDGKETAILCFRDVQFKRLRANEFKPPRGYRMRTGAELSADIEAETEASGPRD